jgi:hypothetical protein
MAVAYAMLDEGTVRSALNRLETVCAVQDSKLEYLNAQLRVLQDSVATAATEANAARGANRQKFLVNLKHMSPEKYAGLRGAIPFRSWSQDIKDLVARFSVELLNAMTATENQAERIPSNTIPPAVQDEDAQLRSALRAFTVAEPRAVINAAIDRGDSGLEIWRTLVTQYDPDNDSTRLDESTYILNPGKAKNMSEVQLLLTKWEDAMNHRSKMLGRTALDDDLKRSVLLKLLPTTEESELRHQRILFKTYESLRSRVIELISERTKGPAPMLHHITDDAEENEEYEEEGEWVMRIEEANGRQQRIWSQKGKGKGKSKGKGTKGKGKSKGKGPECYRCGRNGHMRQDCYSKTHISGGDPVEFSKKGNLNTLEEEDGDTELHGIDICMLEASDWTTVIRKSTTKDPFDKPKTPQPLLMVSPFGPPQHSLVDPFKTPIVEPPTKTPQWLSAKAAPATWEDDEEWGETEEWEEWWEYAEDTAEPPYIEPAPGLHEPLRAAGKGRAAGRAATIAAPAAPCAPALQQALTSLATAASQASRELHKVMFVPIPKQSYYEWDTCVDVGLAKCVGSAIGVRTATCVGSAIGDGTATCVGSAIGVRTTACVGSAIGDGTATCVGSAIGVRTTACVGSGIGGHTETGEESDISSEDFGNEADDSQDEDVAPELELHAVDAMDVEQKGWNRFDIVVDSGAAQSVADGNLWPGIARTESEGSRNGAVYLGPGKERIPNRGQKTLTVKTGGSANVRKMTFQDAAIRKPLAAVSGITEKGNVVLFDRKGSFIAPEDAPEVKTIRELIRQVKNRIELEEKKGIYIMPIWVQSPEAAGVFSRPGH